MSFSQAAKQYPFNAVTANGMKAYADTSSAVLDLFGKIGASRGKDISADFARALAENEELAIRTLLWSRDIREGAGERAQFRQLLAHLDNKNPALARRIMHKVPFLGRWDDLFAYTDYANRRAAFDMIRAALDAGDGLAAKWMPRKGDLAVELTRYFGMSPKQYRKTLVNLTKVVESQMCAKNWAEINFSHVPSVASARYQKAFGRNAQAAYSAYLAELQKPQAEREKSVKINAGAVYPHDVLKSLVNGNKDAADAQWEALPNFVGNAKIFPIVDTSGSMGSLRYSSAGHVQPIEVSIALGLYCSGKNTSDFKDMFMIFDTTPQLVTASGKLSERVKAMREIVAGSTNLHAAFDMLLDIAVRGRVPAEDMPDVLLVLSDMQFNQCTNYNDSAQEMIARKYSQAGYEVPKIVFWNLSLYGADNTPVKFNDQGVALVSGMSPSVMKAVLANDLEDYTPYNVMLKTLNKERYDY